MKQYSIRPKISEKDRQELAEYSDFMAHMLFHRGIDTKEKAEYFFTHSYDRLHDPFLLKDMDKAVDRILSAIETKEITAIYSDYDADGIPAAVVLSDFFDKVGYKDYFVYIPHRNKEGFGLNVAALDTIRERGATLLITLDCGIADVEQTEYAKRLGIDVIITDHHETNGIIPDAYAIVNPKQAGCVYPEKMLCGSGVAFKLVQALIKKGNFNLPQGWEKTLLDMVGIATLSDMVPLTGENRTLASFGLTVLRMSPRKGLHKLLRKSRVEQKTLSEDDIGFTIAPRINAASRMDAPELAFQMLKARDYVEAGVLVDHLHKINDERKGHVAAMVKEIKRHVQENERPGVIVAGNVKWQPSLLGLAANTICEEYGRPVFLWGRGEGSDLKGSCRSSNVSVVEILGRMPETVLETWGGHHQAGGFVVKKEAADFLYDELTKIYKTFAEQAAPIFYADYNLKLNQITDAFWKDISKLSPFGQDNQKPIFVFENVMVKELKKFGKKQEHLSLTLSDGNSEKEAIAFFRHTESWYKPIKESEQISLVAHIEKNNFGRNNNLRLRIVDIL